MVASCRNSVFCFSPWSCRIFTAASAPFHCALKTCEGQRTVTRQSTFAVRWSNQQFQSERDARGLASTPSTAHTQPLSQLQHICGAHVKGVGGDTLCSSVAATACHILHSTYETWLQDQVFVLTFANAPSPSKRRFPRSSFSNMMSSVDSRLPSLAARSRCTLALAVDDSADGLRLLRQHHQIRTPATAAATAQGMPTPNPIFSALPDWAPPPAA